MRPGSRVLSPRSTISAPAGAGARPLDEAVRGAAAERKGAILPRPRLAHRGEPRAQRNAGVLHPDDDAPFVGIDRLAAIIAAGIAGQVDVEVDEAGEQCPVAEVDDLGARGRWRPACVDRDDAVVGDGHGRGAERRLVGIDDHAAGVDDGGLGIGLAAKQRQRRRGGQSQFAHGILPCLVAPWWRGTRGRASA